MKRVAELLNSMRAAGVVSDYALFGAAAQMRYTEAVATLDADVLVKVPDPARLDVLAPIYAFCLAQGYTPQGEAVCVGAWPVQFIPVFNTLTGEAVDRADTADFEGIPLRVVGPDYLAVIALEVGRAKDYARIIALLDAGSVSDDRIAWARFKARFLE